MVTDLTVDEVLGRMREQIEPFKIPRRCVPLDELPVNGNGKVDRKRLASLAGADEPPVPVAGQPRSAEDRATRSTEEPDYPLDRRRRPMERKDVVQALETALTDVLERPVTGLRGEIRLFDDLHLDSTTMLEMLMALEDSIGLVVDPEELDVDDFESVDTFTDFVLSGPLAPSSSASSSADPAIAA